MKLLKLNMTVALAAGLTAVALAQPASAQKVNSKHLEKANWHNAPRQFQIIDDRPIIKDFREAPQASQQISMPPPPQGFGGGARGGGAGAMGDDGGSMGGNSPIRAAGAPGDLPYRTGNGGSLPLPKSGFGRSSNIPAGGMAPKNALPSGQSTNRLMGKMMAPQKVLGRSGGSPRGMSPSRGATNGGGPKVSSYSGGYGDGHGSGYGGSSTQTNSIVRGSLLKKSSK